MAGAGPDRIRSDGVKRDGGRPRVLGPEGEHYWLVLRMAKATGVDLAAAMAAGALSAGDWAGMVTRCRGCTQTDGCERWLDRNDFDRPDFDRPDFGWPEDGLRAVPEDCANRRLFERFRALAEPPLADRHGESGHGESGHGESGHGESGHGENAYGESGS